MHGQQNVNTCSLSVYTLTMECVLLGVLHIKSDTNNILDWHTDIMKMYTLTERCDKCVGVVSIATYINFGIRKGLRKEPLRDVEISVFVCVYILKMGRTGHVAGLEARRAHKGL